MTFKPLIMVNGPIAPIVDQAIAALAAEHLLYERGDQLVEVIVDRRDQPHGHQASAARSVVVTAHRVTELAEGCARWEKQIKDEEGGGFKLVPTAPPPKIIQTVLDRKHWPMPRLHGITETPFPRPDGSICTITGYDPATGYFCAPSPHLNVSVHAEVTIDDAEAALATLYELLGDFPFESDAHRSCAVAAILTLVARPAISGPVPLFAVTASTPAAGKSLLVDVIHEVAVGRMPYRTPYAEREDEFEKRITSILMSASTSVCIDNVNGTFGSASLDALLTTTQWMGRELGRSHMVEVPARAVWFCTGNNLRIKGDLARRVIPVRLEPVEERPEERTEFKVARIIEHVREHRSRYLSAALTVLVAYQLRGSKPEMSGYGTYEAWSDIVRAALVWAGAADPVEAARSWAEDADEQRESYLALAAAWAQVIGAAPVTLSELPSMAQAPDRIPLYDALKVLAGRADGIDTRLLGNLLRRERNRRFGRWRWDYAEGKTHGARRWRLITDTKTEGSQRA